MSKRTLFNFLGLLTLGPTLLAQVPDTTRRSGSPKAFLDSIATMPPVGTVEELRQYQDISAGPLVAASRQRAVLTLEASGMFDSNALRNELVMGLYRGETLDRDLRQRTADDLKGNNRGGTDASMRFCYSWGRSFLGRSHWRPMIGVAYHDLTGMRFTDAVYDLTFFGNAMFEGEAAVIAPTAAEQQRYQTLGFGLKHAWRETFLRLDVVNGQYLNAVQLDRGYLYTAPYGTYLEADLDGSWHTSDTSGQSFGRSNGLGLAVSGALELRSNTMRYTFRVEDLGFIAWNSNAQQLHKDEVIRYDGLYVDDIVDFSGTILGETQLRDTLGLQATTGGFLRPLPARFVVGLSKHQRNGHFRRPRAPEQLTLEHLVLPGYIPHITYALSVPFSRHWVGFGKVGYGGFGGLRLGLGTWGTTDWGLVKLEVPNVVGTLSPSAKGKAVMIGLELAF